MCCPPVFFSLQMPHLQPYMNNEHITAVSSFKGSSKFTKEKPRNIMTIFTYDPRTSLNKTIQLFYSAFLWELTTTRRAAAAE